MGRKTKKKKKKKKKKRKRKEEEEEEEAVAAIMETLLMHPHRQTASSRLCYAHGGSSLHLRSAPRFVRLLPVNPIHGRGHGRLQPRHLLPARAAKGRRRYGPGVPQQKGIPTFPKIEDDGNPKFVVFVRDKRVPLWFPLSIITGGNLAKVVVTAMGNEWGKKMAQSTLTRDLGNALYKDEKAMRMSAVKAHPILKTASELEYGYKIVNMEDQRSAFLPSNVTKIPPKEELVSVLEKVKGFIGESVSGIKETFNFADQGQSDTTKD